MYSVIFSDALLNKANTKLAFALTASLLLSACGAGGGSGSTEVASSDAGNQGSEIVEQTPVQIAPVEIFSHPQNLTVDAGQKASLSVAASGGGTLRYQWVKGSVAIQGATSNTLVIDKASSKDAGVYSVVVSNSAGSQTSLSAALIVRNVQTPVIVVPPAVETPVVEQPAVETPVVEQPSVETPVVEQPAVETPVVEQPAVETPVVEQPVVETPVVEEPVVETPVVEEPVVETPVVEDSVVTPATIVRQPASQIVDENNSANFSIEVSGGSDVSYQWLKDGVVVEGANSFRIIIAKATSDDAGDYSVVITSNEGVIFSDVASLVVNPVATEEVVTEEVVTEEVVTEEVVTEEVAPVVTLKSIALSWDMPQQREDGSALESYEIDGYVIAYGTDANNLNQQMTIVGAQVLEAVVEDLAQGTYYFAIATVDSDGTQGAYSATIQQSI